MLLISLHLQHTVQRELSQGRGGCKSWWWPQPDVKWTRQQTGHEHMDNPCAAPPSSLELSDAVCLKVMKAWSDHQWREGREGCLRLGDMFHLRIYLLSVGLRGTPLKPQLFSSRPWISGLRWPGWSSGVYRKNYLHPAENSFPISVGEAWLPLSCGSLEEVESLICWEALIWGFSLSPLFKTPIWIIHSVSHIERGSGGTEMRDALTGRLSLSTWLNFISFFSWDGRWIGVEREKKLITLMYSNSQMPRSCKYRTIRF